MKKKKQIAMLREWIGEVLNSSASVTVQMERVPIFEYEKVFKDWPNVAEYAKTADLSPEIWDAANREIIKGTRRIGAVR